MSDGQDPWAGWDTPGPEWAGVDQPMLQAAPAAALATMDPPMPEPAPAAPSFQGSNPFAGGTPMPTQAPPQRTAAAAPPTSPPRQAPAPVRMPPAQAGPPRFELTAPVAVLGGTIQQPRLSFITGNWVSTGDMRNIRDIPKVAFHGETRYLHPHHGPVTGAWRADAVPKPALLNRCIIDVATGTQGTSLAGTTDLHPILQPYAEPGPEPGTVRIWPRLGGYDAGTTLIPAGATWQRGKGHWLCAPIDLLDADGNPRAGIVISDPDLIAQGRQARGTMILDEDTARIASTVAAALDPADAADELETLTERYGQIPDWFGMDLFGYQKTAPVAMAAGLPMLCDEPGTGKSVMSLAACALLAPQRIVIAAPAIALTHWAREAARTGLPDHMGDGAKVVKIVSGRKQPPLPDRGIVITTPSLIRSREALLAELRDWAPDVFVFDESHVAKTWEAKTSVATRSLASACGRSFPLTGTPIQKSPEELAAQLDIAGLLGPVFGGYSAFMDRYMYRGRFNDWQPRKKMLPELTEKLNRYCWVRRTKAQVQSDMPPKMRSARFVDVKPTALVEANRKITEKIGVWLDEYAAEHGGAVPSSDVIESYAGQNFGLSTPLREATGIAKIPAAVEQITDWVGGTRQAEDGTWERPLIVWVHHHVVMDALRSALDEAHIPHAVLSAGMGADKMGQVAAEFQDGKFPILVASIRAAGTGVTLTRASDELFVETDWSNAQLSQAESRAHRQGQDRPVLIETMIAPGTLDVAIQKVLRRNARLLLETTPTADVDVAVIGDDEHVESRLPRLEEIKTAGDIVSALVYETIAARERGGTARA